MVRHRLASTKKHMEDMLSGACAHCVSLPGCAPNLPRISPHLSLRLTRQPSPAVPTDTPRPPPVHPRRIRDGAGVPRAPPPHPPVAVRHGRRDGGGRAPHGPHPPRARLRAVPHEAGHPPGARARGQGGKNAPFRWPCCSFATANSLVQWPPSALALFLHDIIATVQSPNVV